MILASVSRETLGKLEIYVEMLGKWNRAINLVSRTTIDDVWRRHIRDSLQLVDLAPIPSSWLDLGSGGGVPGLVIAAKIAETTTEQRVTLVESDQRKCAFLAAAADAMELSVSIECRRIEESTGRTYDVISARALASLPELLELALPYRHENTICIFPKGVKADAEMSAAQQDWKINFDARKSVTDPSATIFRLQEYSRVHRS